VDHRLPSHKERLRGSNKNSPIEESIGIRVPAFWCEVQWSKEKKKVVAPSNVFSEGIQSRRGNEHSGSFFKKGHNVKSLLPSPEWNEKRKPRSGNEGTRNSKVRKNGVTSMILGGSQRYNQLLLAEKKKEKLEIATEVKTCPTFIFSGQGRNVNRLQRDKKFGPNRERHLPLSKKNNDNPQTKKLQKKKSRKDKLQSGSHKRGGESIGNLAQEIGLQKTRLKIGGLSQKDNMVIPSWKGKTRGVTPWY